jgi:hypothetical protein
MNFAQKSLTFFSLARANFLSHWQGFWALWPFRLHFLFWLATLIFCWVQTYLLAANVNQVNVNLHYNILFGTDLIGPTAHLYFLPASALLMSLINMLLAIYLLRQDRLLAYLSAGSAIMINLFMALGIYSLYLINFVKLF